MPKTKTNVDLLRNEVKSRYKHIYFHDKTEMGMWKKRPRDWPNGLPFGDPHNSKNLRKDHLLQMVAFLRKKQSDLEQRPSPEQADASPYDITMEVISPDSAMTPDFSTHQETYHPHKVESRSSLPGTHLDHIHRVQVIHDHCYHHNYQPTAEETSVEIDDSDIDVTDTLEGMVDANFFKLRPLTWRDVAEQLGDKLPYDNVKVAPPENKVPKTFAPDDEMVWDSSAGHNNEPG